MKRGAALVGGIFFAFGIVVACSSSDNATPAPDYNGSCSVLASRCHPYDGKSALGHECHELGHAGDDSKCGPKRAECEAECPPTDAALPFQIVDGEVINPPGSGNDAATSDAAIDAAPDPCVPYCECLQSTCSTQSDYIYSGADPVGTCVATCKANFTADEKDCWSKFCEHAKTLSEANRGHECDHSMGKFNLDECETL